MCASNAEPESPTESIQCLPLSANPATENSIPVRKHTHDPYRRITDLLQRLAPGKMRIGFFLGAGCPLFSASAGPIRHGQNCHTRNLGLSSAWPLSPNGGSLERIREWLRLNA